MNMQTKIEAQGIKNTEVTEQARLDKIRKEMFSAERITLRTMDDIVQEFLGAACLRGYPGAVTSTSRKAGLFGVSRLVHDVRSYHTEDDTVHEMPSGPLWLDVASTGDWSYSERTNYVTADGGNVDIICTSRGGELSTSSSALEEVGPGTATPGNLMNLLSHIAVANNIKIKLSAEQ